MKATAREWIEKAEADDVSAGRWLARDSPRCVCHESRSRASQASSRCNPWAAEARAAGSRKRVSVSNAASPVAENSSISYSD